MDGRGFTSDHGTHLLATTLAAESDVPLYDLTNSYVESAAPRNPMLRRRYSRDHRSDCLQVGLSVIVNVDGFPLSYETFDHGRTDVTTLEAIMPMVERKYGQAHRVWVFDHEIRLRHVALPTLAQQRRLDQLTITVPEHLEWNAGCSGDLVAS